MTRLSKVYLFLAILSACTWALDEYLSGDEFFQQDAIAHSPDYIGIGYTKIEMNEQGVPRYKLYADRMTHYSDDNSTEMDKPVLTYYNPKTPPWVIRSETGLITQGYEQLFLNGKVFIRRDQAPGIQSVKVNTSNARIWPKENYAETDDWAELIMLPDKVSGTGAKLYFVDPFRLELLSNVRGRYAAR
jgi:lipopolysaccharide export system protein LptC